MLKKIKKGLLRSFPKKYRSKIKGFYLDYISWPLHRIGYFFRYGQGDFFNVLAIETTTYCNLRCSFCPNSKYERGLKKNKKLIDIELFKKIVKELAEIKYSGKIQLHFYGEPLTDERLPELVSYLHKRVPKAKININTNGFLLTIPIYEDLIKRGANMIYISEYTKMPPKVKELFEYIREKKIKNHKIKYRRFSDSTEEFAIYNRGGEIKTEKKLVRPPCIYSQQGFYIDYKGDVVLCCNDYHSSVTFGNLKEKTIMEIWNSKKFKKIRKELWKKNFSILPICKKCVGLE